MFPFPNRIIGSKQLFIPIAYVGITCSICYYFLIAFVDSQRFLLQTEVSLESTNGSKTGGIQRSGTPSGHSEAHPRIESPKFESQEERLGLLSPKKFIPPSSTRDTQDESSWIDNLSPAFYPWPEDGKCKTYLVQFAKKKTFKPRALVSYPGSGNSWTRYLLEGSSGIFTGSIFGDEKLYALGLLGESRSPNDGSTIVQKTHHDTISSISKNRRAQLAQTKLTELMFGYRGILLIRNPFDALRSYWNFIHTRDHKAHASQTQFSLSKWVEFVEDGAKKWSHLVQIWLEKSADFIIVQYEELQSNPKREIIRMLEYLSLPVDDKRMDCVLSHREGPFHRQPPNDPTQQLSYTSNNSHLNLVVQENIEHVNRLFALNNIDLRLNYTLASNELSSNKG
ncbi:unnamed protein product [Allacma fusca]|uniref:Sulfotransferase domain-containing protein n=1 Tax=Allacma fusca TaxID=39272 RepID=A0A8J2JX97_9HEXA|nr:unnamed protein product [Allacma fusca]